LSGKAAGLIMRYFGFPPYFNESSKVLILGSFPSVKSRESGFFYGNNQNRFWRVLACALNDSLPKSVEEKKEMLFRHGIAVWDIVASCEIEGSMDGSIKNIEVADLYEVLKRAKIQKILLNGSFAAKIFKKHYSELTQISLFLPSTSPANARFNADVWLGAFNDVSVKESKNIE
jgi:TDG/mug DNA glycosylase family protein